MLLLVAGATTCRDCDHEGCVDTLRVMSLGEASDEMVEVCVRDECVVVDSDGGVSHTEVRLPPGDSVEVLVRVHGTAAAEERRWFPVRAFRPNGPDCPPACRLVEVTVSERGFA